MQAHKPDRSHWLLFFIWPLLALWQALRHPKRKWSRNVVWAFIIFFGFTFVIPNSGVDANRYRDNLVNMYSQRDLDWKGFTNLLYGEGTNFLDIFQPVITFLVSRITDDYRVLFAVFGFVFGYFYTRNIWMVIDHLNDRISRKAIVFIVFFSLIVAFWQINGFRFWTATHIYLFGVLTYMIKDKKWGLLVAVSSVFMHFAFIYPVVVLGLYLLLGNRVHIYFVLFILSAFFVELKIEDLIIRIPSLPSIYQDKVNDYTNQSYLSRLSDAKGGFNWYVPMRAIALKYMLYVYLIAAYIFRLSWIKKSGLIPMFCFALLIFSLASLTTVIPSFTRYVIVSELFVLAFIIYFICWRMEPRILRNMYPVFLLVIGLYLIVELRFGMDFLGVGTVISNPVVVYFFSNDTPLIDFIK